jgi:dUTP pyrophosphatase
MEIRFKKLVPEAKNPYRMHAVDAGFDLFCTSIDETLDFIQYHTGIAVEIPEGYVGLIFPRSSVTKYDLMLKNSVGVIDASYRGEILCRFHETREHLDYVQSDKSDEGTVRLLHQPRLKRNVFEVGDRVAQIVFLELPKITLIEANELSDTERGGNGFGSSGLK